MKNTVFKSILSRVTTGGGLIPTSNDNQASTASPPRTMFGPWSVLLAPIVIRRYFNRKIFDFSSFVSLVPSEIYLNIVIEHRKGRSLLSVNPISSQTKHDERPWDAIIFIYHSVALIIATWISKCGKHDLLSDSSPFVFTSLPGSKIVSVRHFVSDSPWQNHAQAENDV